MGACASCCVDENKRLNKDLLDTETIVTTAEDENYDLTTTPPPKSAPPTVQHLINNEEADDENESKENDNYQDVKNTSPSPQASPRYEKGLAGSSSIYSTLSSHSPSPKPSVSMPLVKQTSFVSEEPENETTEKQEQEESLSDVMVHFSKEVNLDEDLEEVKRDDISEVKLDEDLEETKIDEIDVISPFTPYTPAHLPPVRELDGSRFSIKQEIILQEEISKMDENKEQKQLNDDEYDQLFDEPVESSVSEFDEPGRIQATEITEVNLDEDLEEDKVDEVNDTLLKSPPDVQPSFDMDEPVPGVEEVVRPANVLHEFLHPTAHTPNTQDDINFDNEQYFEPETPDVFDLSPDIDLDSAGFYPKEEVEYHGEVYEIVRKLDDETYEIKHLDGDHEGEIEVVKGMDISLWNISEQGGVQAMKTMLDKKEHGRRSIARVNTSEAVQRIRAEQYEEQRLRQHGIADVKSSGADYSRTESETFLAMQQKKGNVANLASMWENPKPTPI